VPAVGAGRRETKASQDHYKFTATTGQTVYVDWTTCLNNIRVKRL
jgi:hypothetical protein